MASLAQRFKVVEVQSQLRRIDNALLVVDLVYRLDQPALLASLT
jgi:hypothetical protein